MFKKMRHRSFFILLALLIGRIASHSVFAQSWVATSAPVQSWTSLAASADGTRLAAVVHDGGIYLSTNSGSAWFGTSAPAQSWISTASSADGSNLVAAANGGGIFASTNSGQNWFQTSAPSNTWFAVASSGDGTALAAVVDQGGIFTSADSGLNWQQTSASTQQWSSVASSLDGTVLIAAAEPGAIYTSTNSGATWISNNAPILSWSAVAASSDGTRLVAAATLNGIYASTNAGVSWVETSAPTNAWFALASSADGINLVAAGTTSGIYTSTNSGLTWIRNSAPTLVWSSVTSSADGSKLVAAAYNGGIYIPGLALVGLTKGTYQGLFYDTNGVALQSSGFFSAVTATNGRFSAKLQMTGKTYSYSGQFSAAGAASNVVSRAKLSPLTVQLQLNPAGDGLSGVISNDTWTAELFANRAVYSKTNPAPQAGKYTLLIPGGDGSPAQPGGDGFGTAAVDGLGNVTFSGTLADGTKVSQKTFASGLGEWPLYGSLYSGNGMVLGWLTFTNQATNDITGLVDWIKLPKPGAKLYPAGFTNSTEVLGSRYVFTNGIPVLNLSTGQVWLANGNLTQSFTNQIVLGANNKVTGTNKLSLAITSASGLFKGTVPNPVSGKSVSFQGIILEKQNFGGGFFLGTNQSGRVFIGP